MKWLFIGAGNMASSLISGLIASNTDPAQIAVVDLEPDACRRAEQSFGVLSAATIEIAIDSLFQDDSNISAMGIVIAVKPHTVKAICTTLNTYLQSNNPHSIEPVFISVAAGILESSMRSWLPKGAALVRCMPNTPALIGLGATALYANDQCSAEHRQVAQTLLECAGLTLWVDNESALDAVTAVSGSGPAYFFYLIEHMIDAGVELGLTRETAETLAIETAYGAASMAREKKNSPAVLRKNVTSEGGTTAAALNQFNASGTPEIIRKALKAAQTRAVELGNKLAN